MRTKPTMGTAAEIHPALVQRHLELTGGQRRAERRAKIERRRMPDRRFELGGMAAVEGLDRRRRERRAEERRAPGV